jgi:hypothetical protein
METMGWAARVEFDTKYNAGAALKHLEAAYESALSGSKRAAPLDCDLIQTEPRERMEHQTGGD